MKAAEASGNAPDVRERIRKIVGAEKPGGFVSTELGRELRP
jgi:hypothetical protein